MSKNKKGTKADENRLAFLREWESNPFLRELWSYDFEAAYAFQRDLERARASGELKGDPFFDEPVTEAELEKLSHNPEQLPEDAGSAAWLS